MLLRESGKLALSLMVVALLSACSTHEPMRAAMVPQSANGEYGYTDTPLDATRYEVTYVSPRLHANADSDNNHGLEVEKQRVYEFALWRAAQLADSKGYPAFKVTQESRDVDVTVRREQAIAPYYGPWGPWGYRAWPYGAYGYWPYDYGYGWPGYYSYTTASGRVTVKLTIQLLAQLEEGAMETSSTLDHLRKTHGSDGFSVTY
jgi:hypothetical protein